jgi:hypothetical protein
VSLRYLVAVLLTAGALQASPAVGQTVPGFGSGIRFRGVNFRPQNFSRFNFRGQSFRPLSGQPIQFGTITFPAFNSQRIQQQQQQSEAAAPDTPTGALTRTAAAPRGDQRWTEPLLLAHNSSHQLPNSQADQPPSGRSRFLNNSVQSSRFSHSPQNVRASRVYRTASRSQVNWRFASRSTRPAEKSARSQILAARGPSQRAVIANSNRAGSPRRTASSDRNATRR